ncbi:hypothetical protein HZA55_10095 [Candidatus Poribacteria bacterium]|nr:hypothetical protein [Candidatus Poribacteria bacterium]
MTINSKKVDVARTIYKWANEGEIFHKGAHAAKFILEKQEEALDALKTMNINLKVNIVYIPGVNDFEIEDIITFVKQKNASIVNIMPFIPTAGTYFENFPMVSNKTLNDMRKKMSNILPQMMHCQQCRADAVGKIFEETPIYFDKNIIKDLPACHAEKLNTNDENVVRIALTSSNGYIVDQHFGHAKDLLIYDASEWNIRFVERRNVSQYCAGKAECIDPKERMKIIKEKLADCDGLLVMRIGDVPRNILEKSNIYVNMTYNRIEDAIKENYVNILKIKDKK